MIIIQDTLISEDLFEEHFVCDLSACKGACCVEGDSGAPVEEEERALIEQSYEAAKEYMIPEGIAVIERDGLFVVDDDGDLVTPLVSEKAACAFVHYSENGTALCALETAWKAGKSEFRKPISCHLYPIRLTTLMDYTGLNYHRWPICAPACECGSKLKVPVFRFLKDSIIRKFGEAYFEELEVNYQAWLNERTS